MCLKVNNERSSSPPIGELTRCEKTVNCTQKIFAIVVIALALLTVAFLGLISAGMVPPLTPLYSFSAIIGVLILCGIIDQCKPNKPPVDDISTSTKETSTSHKRDKRLSHSSIGSRNPDETSIHSSDTQRAQDSGESADDLQGRRKGAGVKASISNSSNS